MKILQLCKKFPFPVRDGETVAVSNLARALKDNGAVVTLLAMNTTKHFFQGPLPPAAGDLYARILTADVDNRVKALPALANLFSAKSYHISRFESPAFGRCLETLLAEESFDAILMETLYLAPYLPIIRARTKAMVVLRSHNVEFLIWERIARQARFPLKKWYLTYLTRKLREYENAHLNQFDFMLPISSQDERQFRQMGWKGPGFVLPVVVNVAEYLPDQRAFHQPASFSFIGSLDWMPNAEGLLWFLQRVWRPYKQQLGTATFHIAGRNAPDWLQNLDEERVVFCGEVPSASDFMNQHPVLLVPLLAGSGMRVKIIEGMALGRVVITTTLGLEGIPAVDGEQVLVADTPEEFLAKMTFCREQPEAIMQIGNRAREFVRQHYDRKEKGRQLMEALEKKDWHG